MGFVERACQLAVELLGWEYGSVRAGNKVFKGTSVNLSDFVAFLKIG